MNSVIAEKLRNAGFRVRQVLTLYTVDPWKGKDKQLEQFLDREVGKKYVEWPLERVPDPRGCHGSWVDHYWGDFGNYLDYFAKNVEVITTGEMYREHPRMREFVLITLRSREKLIDVMNKYRGRNPYSKDWVPFEPICEGCGRVGTAEVTEVGLDGQYVEYRCTYCGYRGRARLSDGKLPWRIEWVGVWYTLGVDFEPYGKDHAMPGGSRDSAIEIAKQIYGIEPPLGAWYEWVGYLVNNKDMGDMGSSDFIGFTPKDWVEVAEPEVLRYIYIYHEPNRRIILSLDNVYHYVDMYDRAERLYYGLEKPSPREMDHLELITKSYLYAQLGTPPKEPPVQLPYLHAVALIQTLPETQDVDELLKAALKRLSETRVIRREELGEEAIGRIRSRLIRARVWLRRYAPETYRIRVIDEVPEEVKSRISEAQLEKLRVLLNELAKLTTWNEDNVKEAMKRVPRKDEVEEKDFFRAVYLIFFGKDSGPRIAPYLAMLGRDKVITRLREVLR